MDDIEYDFATKTDTSEIKQLLSVCFLPFEDIDAHIKHFIIARNIEGKLIGAIGLEVLGKYGLLRSFAVLPECRKRGIGNSLYQRMINYVKEKSIKELFLLTTTAEKFFRHQGFSAGARMDAPPELQETNEFLLLCPSIAICMSKKIN